MMAHPRKIRVPDSSNKDSAVTVQLKALEAKTHKDLKAVWAEWFGVSAPHNLSRPLLLHALAYEVQVRAGGGLTKGVRQQLNHIARTTGLKKSDRGSRPPPITLTPGTRLIREWRGTVHVVDVTEDGPVWNGRVYSSLSAIARTITGTRWSGNRFFGLRKRSDAPPEASSERIKSSAAGVTHASERTQLTLPRPEERKPPRSQSDTKAKSDSSQPPDNVGTEDGASLADASKHAPSQVCSHLEPEPSP